MPGIDVVPVTLPGRESRFNETPHRRLDALLRDVIDHIAPHLDQPFALAGHSMGALVAFELARELRRHRLPEPTWLFVSAFRAPHLPESRAPLHALPDALLKAELRRLDGTPSEVLGQPDLVDSLLPVLRADLELVERYRFAPESPLACAITCLGGLSDRRVRRHDLEGWRHQTTGPFRLRLFPGGHFFLYRTPRLVQLAISADLSVVAAHSSGRGV